MKTLSFPLIFLFALASAFAAEKPEADDPSPPPSSARSVTFYLSRAGQPDAPETAERRRTLIAEIANRYTANRKTEKGWLELKTTISTFSGNVTKRISAKEYILTNSVGSRYVKTLSAKSWKSGERVAFKGVKGDGYDLNGTAILGMLEMGPEPSAREADIIAACRAGQKFYVRVANDTNPPEIIRYTVVW